MSDDDCRSLEHLIPVLSKQQTHLQLPNDFETYRNTLHHELAKQSPFHNSTTPPSHATPSPSKSHPRISISGAQKSTATMSTARTSAQRSHPNPTANATGLMDRLSDIQNKIVSTDSEISLENRQQRIEWNLKAQEGIIKYRLPDGLADGLLLHNKLQKLMKTNSIHLNDRQFWTTLENRFKAQRQESFRRNMEQLRRSQEEYEKELLVKGSIPHTTEEAIRLHAERQRTLLITNPIPTNDTNRKTCFVDYLETRDESKKETERTGPNEDPLLDPFETDNVHPRFHQIFEEYRFQSATSEEIAVKNQDRLKEDQEKLKTLFPKINQRDRIREELDAIKTSEGLYAYSNRLSKKIVKS